MVLKEVIKRFQGKWGSDTGKVVVMASTGAAAFTISGTTLHALGDIQLGKEPTKACVSRAKRDQRVRVRWSTVEG